MQACACSDARPGNQTCDASGAFEPCACGDLTDGSGTPADLSKRDLSSGPAPDLRPALPACSFASPCWQLCLNNGTSLSTCKSNCGATSGPDCWLLCISQDVGLSTCKSYCGANPGCPAAACWSLCIAQKVSLSTCDSYCGHDKTTACSMCSGSPSAWSNCYALCADQGVSTSTCMSYCGP